MLNPIEVESRLFITEPKWMYASAVSHISRQLEHIEKRTHQLHYKTRSNPTAELPIVAKHI